MEASVVDLRYKMKDVLEALERREKVRILYHGKLKGTIIPASGAQKLKIADHPFFGMRAAEKASVSEMMDNLRGGRHNAL
jgi:antitoxin (DNA-binding transcriptional repressor) of toxin-antitoxin stability system